MIATIKNVIENLLTPSTDSIISSFTKAHARLLKRAEIHARIGEQLHEQADFLRLKATSQYAEVERAERLAEKFQQFAQ
jgi:hypothetical protein